MLVVPSPPPLSAFDSLLVCVCGGGGSRQRDGERGTDGGKVKCVIEP